MPVTVLSAFLGAGKTTLLNHVLAELLVDQVEFADVISCKTGLVGEKASARVTAVLRRLNPSENILSRSFTPTDIR